MAHLGLVRSMRHLLASLLVIAACHVAAAHSVERWTSGKVVGLYCELIDPVRVENYFFDKQRIVAVTIGTKSSLTAPLGTGESGIDDCSSPMTIPSESSLHC